MTLDIAHAIKSRVRALLSAAVIGQADMCAIRTFGPIQFCDADVQCSGNTKCDVVQAQLKPLTARRNDRRRLPTKRKEWYRAVGQFMKLYGTHGGDVSGS